MNQSLIPLAIIAVIVFAIARQWWALVILEAKYRRSRWQAVKYLMGLPSSQSQPSNDFGLRTSIPAGLWSNLTVKCCLDLPKDDRVFVEEMAANITATTLYGSIR